MRAILPPGGAGGSEVNTKFKVVKVVGKGSYGTVYKVQRLSDGQAYALNVDVKGCGAWKVGVAGCGARKVGVEGLRLSCWVWRGVGLSRWCGGVWGSQGE